MDEGILVLKVTNVNKQNKPHLMDRSDFLKKTFAGGAAIILPTFVLRAQQQEKPPPIKIELVKEFVVAGHGNLARTKEMLENDPQLLHVSNDWGGGDYESAIEGAGHVGSKDVAQYLLSKGARYNIYLASMLGHLDVVKIVLSSNPQLLNSKGPHGFTMLHHANKGNAKEVIDYLVSLGAKETRIDFYAKS